MIEEKKQDSGISLKGRRNKLKKAITIFCNRRLPNTYGKPLNILCE